MEFYEFQKDYESERKKVFINWFSSLMILVQKSVKMSLA